MVVMEVDDALGQSKDRYDELVTMLQREQLEAAHVRVPWFLKNMPPAYFKQVHPELRNQHLSALVALYDFDAVPDLTLNSEDGNTLTVISGGANSPGKLSKQLSKLPTDTPLAGMSVFSSEDGEVSLNIYDFSDNSGKQTWGASMTPELGEYLDDLKAGKYAGDNLHAKAAPFLEKPALTEFIGKHCSQNYVERSSPRRFCKQMELYQEIMTRGTDEVGVDIEANWGGDENRTMITLACTNVLAMAAMKRMTQYFSSKGLNIVRTHLDTVKGEDDEEYDSSDLLRSNTVSMFRILVEPTDQTSAAELQELNTRLEEDLATVSKWSDDRALRLILEKGLSAREADIVVALCDVAHAILAPKDAAEFSRHNVANVVMDDNRFDYTRQVVDLFLKRFDPAVKHPEQTDAGFEEAVNKIRTQIEQSGELRTAQTVYSMLLDVIKATYRTNVFTPNRFGVALRLNPEICVQHLLDEHRNEIPYGIFFTHGRRFAGFHLRFRDISRGGLRVVTPRNQELLGVESARQLQECYDLAFAQQLKNKDIAEGGSKAVCLVDTHGIHPKDVDHVIRKSLKSMVNSMIDVITPNEKNTDIMVDHMGGKEEFIYFGPDEQVTPEHINWIVKRAHQRGYPLPNAFMSSKPDAGMNHKEFGVTSEGVAVFLDEALNATGVDTSKPFTIKITGGPDGDVAGNMLKILHREYGTNARVVGLADGTASLEDPDGIDWDEMLRMFHEVVPLSGFNKSKLGPKGELILADTPAGINARNTMHNRVVADAFVPAGGRPATINDSNWKKYLKEDGTPSSPLVVEGANLFLTPGARDNLSKAGVVIVKDSSANKCGVICSSFEIISSMLLDKEEFLSIKPQLVEDVLEGLRLRAKREAELMFREYKSDPSAPLPPVSERISRAINRSTDALAALLETISDDDMQRLLPVIRKSLPKALMDKAWDRFETKVPPAYIRFQLACIMASELVYREGVDYAMSIKDEQLAPFVLKYIERELHMGALSSKIDGGSSLSKEDLELVSSILKKGGARTMLDHHINE